MLKQNANPRGLLEFGFGGGGGAADDAKPLPVCF